VLTVKPKTELTEKSENMELVTKSAKDYGIRIQTMHDMKSSKIELMEFVRDCDSGAGPSNHNITKSLHMKR
jgi:hypothetical protein